MRCSAVSASAAQIELKLTPGEILHAVTATAARALDLDDRGVLAVGRRADLIVVEGDPLRDLACLANIRAVMKAGNWIDLSGPGLQPPEIE